MDDVGTQQTVARLGFGCASLSLAATRRENEAILGAAWDEGIRWFDVARSYSYGGAERTLGRFLAGRRDEATVVTKFGLRPPQGLLANRAVQAVAGVAVRLLPAVKARGVSAADHRTVEGDFSVTAARDSLHRSLRALRTDRLDGLLLHEANLEDARRDDLVQWLEDCTKQGTVRRWGLAVTDLEVTAAICREVPKATAIVQVPDSLLETSSPQRPGLAAGTLVSHSMLAQDLPRLRSWVEERPERRDHWSDRLGADVGDPSVLARLILAAALARSGDRVVLFSSRSPARCRESAGVPGDLSRMQVAAFEEMTRAMTA